jgi:hypothetical protein
MNKEKIINIINDTLKEHFDYVPLDTTLKITETLIEKGILKVEDEDNLKVCEHCLAAIESREGKQVTRTHYIDCDDLEGSKCEWCEEEGFDVLYELL